jgi:hypothetical protein
MVRRLPALYRGGELVNATLTSPAVQVEILDEELDFVQGERWFDTAVDLADAARVGALLDIGPEPWQDLAEYRPWLHELRTALLERGATTPRAVREFVANYSEAHASATGVRCLPPIEKWSATRDSRRAALIEQPAVRRWATLPDVRGTRPLARLVLQQRGIDASTPVFIIVGRSAGPERSPVIANLRTGQGLVFLGEVGIGAYLTISAAADGGARATRDGEDVSDQLFGIDEVVPGRAWRATDLRANPRMFMLEPGENELWYLPIAHYDHANLDGPMLAMPDLDLRDGIWDDAAFDHALFEQEARVLLRVTWLERVPAAFRIELPAAIMKSAAGGLAAALTAREHLGLALSTAIDRLRPAGVEGVCELVAASEMQPGIDRLRILQPLRLRDVGSVGADRTADPTAAFEESGFDGSNFG